jgi:hypothetical protein
MDTARDFPWDNSRLAAAPTAHRLQPGDRAVLFCATRQKLYELNSTADTIWLAIASEGTPAAAAEALSPQDDPETLNFVRQAAEGWMRLGLLVPAEFGERIEAAPKSQFNLRLDELSLQVRLHGDIDPGAFASVFGQFAGAEEASRSISVAGAGGLVFIFDGRQPLGAGDERTWIPELKARITDWYTKAVSGTFLTHGALLSRDGKGLLICGEPGAGKTTLSVALSTAGFRFHSDDIVRIDRTGRARGVAFAPAVKSGAWLLLDEAIPGLGSLPIYRRSDGQDVRYLPVTSANQEDLPISSVLLLARESKVDAHIDALEPLDALTAILGSAYAPSGALQAGQLETLVSALNTARTGRLTYDSLEAALEAVKTFAA